MLSTADGTDNTPCSRQAISHPNNGSFTLFRLFHQGVLYLHAVDEMDMELQGRLIALIKRKFLSSLFPSGGSTGGMLIFSTSTRPLEACVAAGTFDPALCELLSGMSIHIPPLRHSPERIPALVDYFLNRLVRREDRKGFPHPSASHLEMMRTHRWPGNVKALQEMVKTAFRLNDWDSAISMLTRRQSPMDDYSAVDLSPDGVALMPDFEIRQGRMLECLAERIPAGEMGLMDLVLCEEAMSHNKMH